MNTVLIIETDTDTIEILTGILAESGYAADAVDDIEAARHRVTASPPELIVIGPQLGKSTGFLACSLIKKIPQAKRIPCVLLYTDREGAQVERHRTLAGRAEVYLAKPFNADDFWAAVSEYLSPAGPAGAAAAGGEETEIVVEEDLSAAPMTASQVPPEPVEEVIGHVSLPPVEEDLPPIEEAGGEEVARLQAEVDDLRRRLATAEKQAREVADTAKAKPGSETRQMLELKQALNRRENELVELKEASLQKERQILDLRGKNNDAEMKHLELSDAVAERDREIAGLRGQLDATINDKDVVTKRADDFGRRLKTAQDELKKAKDDAEAQRAAHERELRSMADNHTTAIEVLRTEITASKDADRDKAIAALRADLTADKERALADQKAANEADAKARQERHDREVYDMQERFRRSMNQQEEKLLAEKAQAVKETQERHDAEAAGLVSIHEVETGRLRDRIGALEAALEEKNGIVERQVADIGRLTEDRDEITTRRDILDAEMKASQMAAEQLRIDAEGARARIRETDAALAEVTSARAALRAKLEGDLARVDKARQAVTIAIDMLNDIEPL
ncbi:MAG: response regulator [Myxococcota bacterium]|nr:response regulator [Myxococcota bacterium]